MLICNQTYCMKERRSLAALWVVVDMIMPADSTAEKMHSFSTTVHGSALCPIFFCTLMAFPNLIPNLPKPSQTAPIE